MDVRRTVLKLLDARSSDATVCPSEVARALAGQNGVDWRDLMPDVHAAVDGLISDDKIRLSWKGKPLAHRAGPYRIRRHQFD